MFIKSQSPTAIYANEHDASRCARIQRMPTVTHIHEAVIRLLENAALAIVATDAIQALRLLLLASEMRNGSIR